MKKELLNLIEKKVEEVMEIEIDSDSLEKFVELIDLEQFDNYCEVYSNGLTLEEWLDLENVSNIEDIEDIEDIISEKIETILIKQFKRVQKHYMDFEFDIDLYDEIIDINNIDKTVELIIDSIEKLFEDKIKNENITETIDHKMISNYIYKLIEK